MADNNDTRVAFDLAKAKAGAPVRTRDGRKVRILCFDRAGLRPIVALVKEDDDEESLLSYQEDGTLVTREPEYDLMMTGGKKTGHVNIYRDMIHPTMEKAEKGRSSGRGYVKTVKVEYE